MIDDDDVFEVAMLWPSGSMLLALAGVIVVIVLAVAAYRNVEECSRRKCDHGAPIVSDGQCICAERAK